jgi:hypothetical protein
MNSSVGHELLQPFDRPLARGMCPHLGVLSAKAFAETGWPSALFIALGKA